IVKAVHAPPALLLAAEREAVALRQAEIIGLAPMRLPVAAAGQRQAVTPHQPVKIDRLSFRARFFRHDPSPSSVLRCGAALSLRTPRNPVSTVLNTPRRRSSSPALRAASCTESADGVSGVAVESGEDEIVVDDVDAGVVVAAAAG